MSIKKRKKNSNIYQHSYPRFMSKNVYEYIWMDSVGNLRSKTRVLKMLDEGNYPMLPPSWNYDGSSTGQASGSDSEITIIPRAVYPNPLLKISNSYLAICDTFNSKEEPLCNNHRYKAEDFFRRHRTTEPWYGFEQEYFLIDKTTGRPAGFSQFSEPHPQGPYYCSVENVGRQVVDRHLEACIHAGLDISGTNAEVALGQWEFQIGPVQGICAGDQMIAARYLLEHIANSYNFKVDWSVKPIKGDWNGSGCHVNFSTKLMRSCVKDSNESGDDTATNIKTGLDYIYEGIGNLGKRHTEHLSIYGDGNKERLSGAHETSQYDTFTYGNADRGASVRIGGETLKNKCGYFEDRRPGSNIDPYLVSAKILASVLDLDY